MRKILLASVACGLIVGMALALLMGGCSKPVAQTAGNRFYFTWPGDDGMEGIATSAEIRCDTAAIALNDTLSWWNSAQVRQPLPPPIPKPAGTRDSVEVLGLASQTNYYAVMRAADEVPNWSGFSNVAETTTNDVIPPTPPQNLQGH